MDKLLPLQKVDENEQKDDIYDENAFKKHYRLFSLRPNSMLDYNSLLNMTKLDD